MKENNGQTKRNLYVQSAKLTTHYLFELQFDVNYLLFHVLPIVLRAIQVVSDCSELRNKNSGR